MTYERSNVTSNVAADEAKFSNTEMPLITGGNVEYDKFEALARKLAGVPKSEIDEKRAKSQG